MARNPIGAVVANSTGRSSRTDFMDRAGRPLDVVGLKG